MRDYTAECKYSGSAGYVLWGIEMTVIMDMGVSGETWHFCEPAYCKNNN